MKRNFADLKTPWYVKIALMFCKSKFSTEFKDGVETIQKYKNIGNTKYVLDYDVDIKKKKYSIGIKIIF